MCLAEEAWILRPFQENKSPLPACHLLNNSVLNSGDGSVGGEAGSPGILPGGRKRHRNSLQAHHHHLEKNLSR